MPLDGARYISQMTETLPNNTDPRSEGAGQIRAIKRVLKNTFPNMSGPVDVDPELMNILHQHLFTRGMMIEWTGAINQIPEYWTFADGITVQLAEGGTYTPPDFRDKFSKCASYDANGLPIEDVGETGGDHNGVATHEHPHTHSRGEMEIEGSMTKISETWAASGEADGAFEKQGGYPAPKTPQDTDSSNTGRVRFKASQNWTGSTSLPEGEGAIVGTDGGNQPAYRITAYIVYVGPHTK
ncbi:hypothetical protein [Vibrio phage vB_VpaP_SJSY21]|nr:hypothetical protein [Vibrio phage vB_VpaP_SJSY21]